MIAMFLSLKSTVKRRTNSSTKDDLPAPPVPVIPKTGVEEASESFLISGCNLANSSGLFSAAEIKRATA